MDQKSKVRQIVLSVLIATGGMHAAYAQEAVSDSAASGAAVETTMATAQPDTAGASSVLMKISGVENGRARIPAAAAKNP